MKYLIPPREGDVEFIATHMRDHDARECEALGFAPLAALRESVRLSDNIYTMVDPLGKPIAMLGVGMGLLPEWGAVWLLGTKGIESSSVTFLRQSKEALQYVFKMSGKDVLYNYTHESNEVHHRWLKWLGFKFIRKISLGPNGDQFIEFARLRG